MTCTISHFIDVDNLKDGEIVNHSILLIKGRVRGSCATNQIKLQVECKDATHDVQDEHAEVGEIASDGQYKLLVDLERYVAQQSSVTANVIPLSLQLSFCCTASRVLSILLDIPVNRYRLQPLYIVCKRTTVQKVCQVSTEKEKEKISKACRIIDLNVRLVQCVYAEKTRVAGYGRRTYTLNGPCQIHLSQVSCEEAWRYNENELWQRFAEELLNSTWCEDRYLKFIAFIGCTYYDGAAVVASGDYSYANIHKHLKAHAALGGGGLALFGTAHLYAWAQSLAEVVPRLCSIEPVQHACVPDESNYRRIHGGVYASTLGAVCHELGHIFDLGHTQDGVMGTGFDFLNRVFTVNSVTEQLPDRIINKRIQVQDLSLRNTRITQVRLAKVDNAFLKRYHEQKQADGFYFTRNCAIILAHHKWLHSPNFDTTDDETKTHVTYDVISCCVLSSSQPLRLIELRSLSNAFVEIYYEIKPSSKSTFSFRLPDSALELQKTHYIFVLTANGYIKQLSFH